MGKASSGKNDKKGLKVFSAKELAKFKELQDKIDMHYVQIAQANAKLNQLQQARQAVIDAINKLEEEKKKIGS